MYYLQSRYYDPQIGRFINADSYASTGQGFVGYNMFAYCGNDPICNTDPSGTYYTPGQIHDFVLEDICEKDPKKEYRNTHTVYSIPYWKGKKFSLYGFCDLYDTVTHEIWDAKRFGGGPTCTKLYASAQVKNYVENGTFTKREPAKLQVGGTVSQIATNCFTKPDKDYSGTYFVWYWDAGDGVIFYDYLYVPSGKEVMYASTVIVIGIAIASGGLALGAAAAGGAAAIPLSY